MLPAEMDRRRLESPTFLGSRVLLGRLIICAYTSSSSPTELIVQVHLEYDLQINNISFLDRRRWTTA